MPSMVPDQLTEAPRRWHFIAGLMRELKLKSFVEVGCKEGRTTGFILKEVPDSTVIAIDPWRRMPDQSRVFGGETYEEWDFAKIEKEFWENVGDNKPRCRMFTQTSEEVARQLGSETLDCVFIDAAHDQQSVVADIRRWWPLIRPGGVLVGHDFNHKWPTVERAVAECFDLMEVGVGTDSVWFVPRNGAITIKP